MNHAELLQRAAHAAKNLHRSETEAYLRIYDVEVHKAFHSLQCTSLTNYLENFLHLSPAISQTFVTVVRKSLSIPALKMALTNQSITLSQAKTIASVLTKENAAKWINLCASHTIRDLERLVAQENPELAPVERVRFRAKDQVVVTVTLRDCAYGYLERGQQLLKQSTQSQLSLGETLEKVFHYYIDREDPVIRAERKTPDKRTEREKVLVRDQGACQFALSNSRRCAQRYWVDIHHIKPRSLGGDDLADNMITLCSEHHRMEHAN